MAQTMYSRIRVGMVLAAGIALLCFAIFQIGHGTRWFTHAVIIESHFNRINGLQRGAPVTLEGVNIGAVDSIRFPEDPRESYVVVRMWIRSREAARVRADSIAQIDSMGLLGDKFVELTPGSRATAPAAPGQVIPSRDPVDYEALLQRSADNDPVDNVVAISRTMRSLLEAIDSGHGILAEMVHGQSDVAPDKRLTLSKIDSTFDNLDRLSIQMANLLDKINHGDGLAGAMFSNKNNAGQFFDQMSRTAAAVQRTSDRLDNLMARLDNSKGLASQLIDNQAAGDELLANMRTSSRDLKEILNKINTGQGTAGKLVNDPSLYIELKYMLAESGGWAIRMARGLYNMTHPMAPSSADLIDGVASGAANPAAPQLVPAAASSVSAPPQASSTSGAKP